MATPPTHDSIRITKSFQYRGSAREWSNRYFLTNPVASGNRTAALDAVVAQEATLFGSEVHVVRGEYFVAGSEVPVTVKEYTQPGLGQFTGTFLEAGDTAIVVRYSTSQRTSKNHPIYLFNYYHGVHNDPQVSADDVAPAQLTAVGAYAAKWVNGLTYGGGIGVLQRCGPRGAVALTPIVDHWIGHRDFD